MSVIDYFWPRPPKQISNKSKVALSKDLKDCGTLGLDLGEEHRLSVSPWIRGEDRNARKVNREWLKMYTLTFTKRWAALSGSLWFLAWVASGFLIIEIPLTLLAFVSGCIALAFFYAHKKLNELVEQKNSQ